MMQKGKCSVSWLTKWELKIHEGNRMSLLWVKGPKIMLISCGSYVFKVYDANIPNSWYSRYDGQNQQKYCPIPAKGVALYIPNYWWN